MGLMVRYCAVTRSMSILLVQWLYVVPGPNPCYCCVPTYIIDGKDSGSQACPCCIPTPGILVLIAIYFLFLPTFIGVDLGAILLRDGSLDKVGPSAATST